MAAMTNALQVNGARLRSTFGDLTRAGATAQGGLDRPALSEAHLEARFTFEQMIAERGFRLRRDTAGNLSACLSCGLPDAPTLVLGSHLDSVPNGGRFDGTLGVAAAFEALECIRESGAPLRCDLEAIDFTDEEGTWVSLMGSRAATGVLKAKDLRNPRGSREAFDKALARAGLTAEGILGASRAQENLAGYLEMHIEQGTRLEKAAVDIGVVSGMVGISMYLVTFGGRANHAGTTPMRQRRDATQGAAALALETRRTVMQDFPDCVANVGKMTFAPGSFNIVAERVTAYLEIRSQDPARIEALESALRELAGRIAEEHRLTVDFAFLECVEPQEMHAQICRSIEQAAAGLGLTSMRLPSLAGHDAQSMARICPSGLFFVPSIGGFSHSSLEATDWDDCLRGANTLLHTALRLASHR